MKLLWLPDAVGDLDGIYDYYVIRNPRVAAMLYNKILDDAQILRTNPCIAPKDPSLEDAPHEYRSLVVAKGKYKLTYTILKEKIDWKLINLISIIDRFDSQWTAIERRVGQSCKTKE